MLVRPAFREYRTWITDSRRWDAYRPRQGDIIVATYPKCGTTWMQRIVNLLIFQSPEAQSLEEISPWIDRRFPKPVSDVLSAIEFQTNRRALKTHLPLDGLPLYDEVSYIHVARDGRDAAMSFHNHGSSFMQPFLDKLDEAGLADETIGRIYPRTPVDPAEFFRDWLRIGAIAGQSDGYQGLSFFEFQKTYWTERQRDNLLMVNYADLKFDLESEMRRLAFYLDISVSEQVWPILVRAAEFDSMKRQGAALMPVVNKMFADGKDRFFHKGVNGRWKGVFAEEDLDLYEAKLANTLSSNCCLWLESGRHLAGDPRLSLE